MEVEICTVGGYNEVGKNMTAIRIDDEVILCDMGIFLPPVIDLQQAEDDQKRLLDAPQLIKIGAIPDDSAIEDWKGKVKAIVLGHAHLDHIGAVQYLAAKYRAPIIGSPFAIEVLKSILEGEKVQLPNKMMPTPLDKRIKLTDKLDLELISISHSTLQCSLVAIHTKKGVILYATDFKLDNNPIVGNKPNYKRLRELGTDGKLLLCICECLYAPKEIKTPSESVARELLKDVLLGVDNRDKAIFVTTFASHIPRIRSIIDFGKRLNRRVIILGRSMARYIKAAEKLGLAQLSKEATVIPYKQEIAKKLHEIEKNRGKYLVICTGNQAEPGSILDKIATGQLHFNFREEDQVVFSCKTIPVSINIANREMLENKLKQRKVRIFTDIHVSIPGSTEVVVNDEKGMKIKKIEEIKPGEPLKTLAFDKNLKAQWFDAKQVQHLYSGPLYKITTKSGRSVEVTSGHSLFKLQKGEIHSIKGDNLKTGDYLAIPKQFQWRKKLTEIDLAPYVEVHHHAKPNLTINEEGIYYAKRKIAPRKLPLNSDTARILGYYLAEGSAPRHLSLVFSKEELTLINDDLKPSIHSVFPSNVQTIPSQKNSIEVQFGANILKRIFKKWFGDNARTKKIPQFVYSADQEFKLHFLGAYINGDGHAEFKTKGSKRIRIKTASKKLASDLIYLFNQVGICAKFDHEQKNPPRCIGGNKKQTAETTSYVLRIQSRNDLKTLYPHLSEKYRAPIKEYLHLRDYTFQTYPPQALPVQQIDLTEIKAKKGSYLEEIKLYNPTWKKKKQHISCEILKRDTKELTGAIKMIMDGDLLFDPIKKIETREYTGEVYDLEVPGAENFLGGFGGIFLHNSGHSGREDLRDFISMIKPKHLIPCHGEPSMEGAFSNLAVEMNYKPGETIHVMNNGQKLKLEF